MANTDEATNQRGTEATRDHIEQATADTADEPPAPAPKVDNGLDEARADATQWKDKALRARADYENLKRRMNEEAVAAGRRERGRLIEELVDVLESLEKAVEHLASSDDAKGVSLVHKNLRDTLITAGLQPITSTGARFDYTQHAAVERTETLDADEGTILETVRTGYLLDGHVLRPAMVRVATRPPPGDDEDGMDE